MHIRYVYLLHWKMGWVSPLREQLGVDNIVKVDISNQFINIAIKFVSANSCRNDVSIIVVDIVPVPLLILPIIIILIILDVVTVVTLDIVELSPAWPIVSVVSLAVVEGGTELRRPPGAWGLGQLVLVVLVLPEGEHCHHQQEDHRHTRADPGDQGSWDKTFIFM